MAGWESLPLLPLRCILDHLSENNALAAMSTCRHWRSAMLLFEGHREKLILKARHHDKNLFLARLFRKHTQRLHIYVDCGEDDLIKFMNYVLPQFLDSIKLIEVVFIGPIYLHLNPLMSFAKLNRIITESLVFKHSGCMQKLAIMGCEITSAKSENDRYAQKQADYFTKPLSFSCVTSPADNLLSRCNIDLMTFSSLKHIMVEYELMTTESLETLSQLSNLSQLTLNVIFKRGLNLIAIDWHRVNARYTKPLDVAVNLISLPQRKFKNVIDNVLVDEMNLTSVKVLFCKTVHKPLLNHICHSYQSSLRELVWVDNPHEGSESSRIIRMKPEETYLSDAYNQVNPFILLCWQCVQLKRLVIHGYWIWQYDVVGFLRLRRPLSVEVSAVYERPEQLNCRAVQLCAVRVLATDSQYKLDEKHLNEVNKLTDSEWKPTPWRQLHPGLRNHSTPDRRADYIVNEVLHPLGVT